MRHTKRILILTLLVVALAITPAFGLTYGQFDYDANNNYSYDVSYSEGTGTNQYVILVLKAVGDFISAAPTSLPAVSKDNIVYIDQASAANGTVTFSDFIPRASAGTGNTNVVYIAGEGLNQPVPVGFLQSPPGVAVTGTVVSYGGVVKPTVTLTPASGPDIVADVTAPVRIGATSSYSSDFSFSTVAEGAYTLNISKKSHLAYSKGIQVASEAIDRPSLTLIGGDTNSDKYVSGADLTAILTAFGGSEIVATNGNDINEDTYINGADVSLVLATFGQSSASNY